MNFMAKVLKGVPEKPLQPPEGVVVARVNPETGLRELEDRGGLTEYFFAEFPPKQRDDTTVPGSSRTPGEIRNQLF
jgi:penicillin-binding protein 1A